MTEQPTDRRLNPFKDDPPAWARQHAIDVVRRVFDFEPGSGGMLRLRRRPTTPPVLRITDRYLLGTLDLRAVEFPYLLEFVRCRFEEAPDLRQANLAGCEFRECWLPGLEGQNLTSDNDLRLEDSVVEGRIDLTDGEVHGSLELRGTRMHNPAAMALRADRLQLDGALLATGIEAHGELRIPGLRTGGNVAFAGATLHNPDGYSIDGNGLQVGGNLHCVTDPSTDRRFRSTGRLFLPNARIDSDFSLRGALLRPPREDSWHEQGNDRFFDSRAALVADRIQVSGNIDLDNGFESYGTMRLVSAHVGGSVRMSKATINLSGRAKLFAELAKEDQPPPTSPYPRRSLHFDGSEIGGGIDARDARFAGQLRMVDVTARGSVVLDGSVLANPGSDVLEARRFTTGGNLDIRGVTVFGSMLLPEAKIGANLDMRASRLLSPGRYRRDRSPKPSVDLRVAHIGRDLVFARGERDDAPFRAHGEIRLRRAEVGQQTNFTGALLGRQTEEADPVRTAISAFRFSTQELRLDVGEAPHGQIDLQNAWCALLTDNETFWAASGGIELDDFRYDALAEPVGLHDDDQIKRRLERIRKAMGEVYRPGPYDQFATMLRASGNEEHAATVLIAKQRWRYVALAGGYRLLGPAVRLWSWLQRWMVGYGYRPMRALLWLLLLLIGGTLWFAFQPVPDESNMDDQLIWNPLLYTADHLVPIVDLGYENRWQVAGASQWISAGLVAAGWILATTVAAGLARMLRRNA